MRLRDPARALALALAFVAPAGAAGGDLVVRAGRVLDGSGRERADRVLVIREGRFAREPAPGTAVLDVPDLVAMPGWVDLRSGCGLPPAPDEEASETTPDLRAIDLVDPHAAGFEQALRAGVTTAVVAPGGRAVIGGLAGAVKTDGRPLRERIVEAETALSVTLGIEPAVGNRVARFQTPHGLHFRRPGNRMGVLAEARRALSASGGDASSPAVRGVRAGTLPAWIRARTEADIRSALRLGVEHGFRPLLVEATEAHRLAEAIAAGARGVVLGPLAQQPRTFLEAWEGEDARLATAAVLEAAGVEVAFGSGPRDAPGSLRDWAALAVRGGASRESALAGMTSVPARLAGLDDRVGDLDVGLDGDLVLLAGDPLDPSAPVVAVVVEGRVAWRDTARAAPGVAP